MKVSYSVFELASQPEIWLWRRSDLRRMALLTILFGSSIGLGASALADTARVSSDDVGASDGSESALDAAQLNAAQLNAAQLDAAQPNAAQPNAAQPNAAQLVRSMSEAMKSLNYEGTFVHVQGNHITSMAILHSSDARGELERLSALDGEAREVIRNNTLVTCIWPASKSVLVSKSKQRDLLPKVDADLASNKRYLFSMGIPDRVAGLVTHVVNVMPTDTFRYGYRFWIDQDTHMLLRSMLLDGPHRAVEQVMFTQIDYPISIDVSRFEVSSVGEQISWLEPKKLQATSGLPDILEKQVDRVYFIGLPEGYREVSETYSPMPTSEGPVSHIMLTDGMASVSVYVEYGTDATRDNDSVGLSMMGAMNAFALSTDNAFITAVGEVPADTVRAIALAAIVR